MTTEQIATLAKEYSEEATKTMTSDPNLSDSDINGIKHDVAEWIEELLHSLLRRYCLVEKEKLDNIYQGILVQLDPKNFGYSPYNQGRMDVLKSLFPNLGKIDGAKEQKEHDSNYIEMQKAFAQFDKACDGTIHALDKLINTLCKI